MQKTILTLLSIVFCSSLGFSNSFKFNLNNNKNQNVLVVPYVDSTSVNSSVQAQQKKSWFKTDTGKSLTVAAGLIGLGVFVETTNGDLNKYNINEEFRRYNPSFEDHLDDYIQYLPYAAIYALDFAGVESKHTTKYKTTTLATGIATSLIVIQGLKYSIGNTRPDNSADNSMPSGHTATAFMGAHFLHKEYGERSPFYSIAGYTLATVTGVFRQLNNKHWMSDVLVGAGLGISITEFAYFMNDKWYKGEGEKDIEYGTREINENKPSFISGKVGYASLLERTDVDVPGITAKGGYKLSAEGAYFFNKYLGVGGEIGFQSFPMDIDDDIQRYYKSYGYEITSQAAGNRMYYAGGYFQIPFGKNSIGTKLLAGAISGPDTKIYLTDASTYENEIPNDNNSLVYADSKPHTDFSWSTGIYYKRVLNKNLSLSVYGDYSGGDSRYDVTYIDSFDNTGNPIYLSDSGVSNWDSYSIGGSLNIMVW